MRVQSVHDSALPGVRTIVFKRFRDPRGYFTETFRESDVRAIIPAFRIVQANESFSHAGVLRGLHFQWAPYMGKLVRTVRGRMIDVVLDLRVGSPAYGKIMLFDLKADETGDTSTWIWVPPGCAHGALFPVDTTIEYFCTGEHAPGNEACISPFDAGIDWSLVPRELVQLWDGWRDRAEVSAKDRNGGRSLRDWKGSPEARAAAYTWAAPAAGARAAPSSTVLVTGGSGLLGSELRALLPAALAPSSREFDVREFDQMAAYAEGKRIAVIVHCAADVFAKVRADPAGGAQTNIVGSANVARLALALGAQLVYISTDYVFRGDRGDYAPADAVYPVNLYGWQKLGGECAARLCGENATIVRLSFGRKIFEHAKAFVDQWTTRLPVDAAAARVADVVARVAAREKGLGVVHVAGPKQTVFEYAAALAAACSPATGAVGQIRRADVGAHVPKDTSLVETTSSN